MKKNFRIFTIGYIILLGSLIGAGLYAGAVVAPVIFHSEIYLGSQILSQYQEGLIMSSNFYKLGLFINVAILTIFIYEGYKYKSFERDNITMVASFLAISSGLLFSQYYIPDIILMLQGGEEMTKSIAFINTHKGSELDLKLFILSIFVILLRNLQKALK
ncbi:membrane protein [hydrothermal vent metagenome]|uniref:Membrane protein n=1 Tax=hydrothermal vent metagenome TaxID=652676 RepID=A0A1W1EKW2_9ZZZZ